MKESEATFLLIVGLLMAAFGVGGVEQSLNDTDMITAFVVALLGCGIMGCGVLGLRQIEEFNRGR